MIMIIGSIKTQKLMANLRTTNAHSVSLKPISPRWGGPYVYAIYANVDGIRDKQKRLVKVRIIPYRFM